MFRYSLRTLFAAITVASVLCFVGYLVTRPYYLIERLDCGSGRRVEVLGETGWCDPALPVHFRFTGLKYSTEPPTFAVWACSYEPPPLAFIAAEDGNLIGISVGEPADELAILIDFKTKTYWPKSWHREVDDDARGMIERLRRARGDLWLRNTSDWELQRPK